MQLSDSLSLIIPVYNGGSSFQKCLEAIRAATPRPLEVIVVDDGSTDDSAARAREFGARVFQTAAPHGGPAVARNFGAQHARGAILFFLDADVAIARDTCARVLSAFADRKMDALFGSYDDAPAATNFVAQYKNLMHHYTHQHAREESNSFWAGCGAIRAEAFRAVGGFKTTFARPSIEDIELGSRLSRAGYKIRLEKTIQVKHLKAWSLRSMISSDIFDRAIPWTRLIQDDKTIPRDLNLQTSHRVSAVLCWLLPAAFFSALLVPLSWLAVVALGIALLALNWDLYKFFWGKRGLFFTLRAIPLHWFYYLYSSAVFAYVWLTASDKKTT